MPPESKTKKKEEDLLPDTIKQDSMGAKRRVLQKESEKGCL